MTRGKVGGEGGETLEETWSKISRMQSNSCEWGGGSILCWFVVEEGEGGGTSLRGWQHSETMSQLARKTALTVSEW